MKNRSVGHLRGGLGSVEAQADLSRSALGTMSYTPFGWLRTETDWETLAPTESLNASYGSREGYTGGQDLTSLGVVVLGARIYDPALGRWLAALDEALAHFGVPEIFNTDPGAQFTSRDWLDRVKYEEVYLDAYRDGREAERQLAAYFGAYNRRRLHQSPDNQTPDEIYFRARVNRLAAVA